MKILLCHNHYQQRGGEDEVFDDESALLADYGHEVVRYTRHNDSIGDMSRIGSAIKTLWNGETYRELRELIRRERPHVMHCANTFPLISPSAYYAARDEGVPVVQTLHNYRLLCLNALFLRDGRVCEDCLGKRVAIAGIRHACYRGSRSASAVVAALQTVHRATGTWNKLIDAYIALTEFARQKFIEGGLPEEKIVVKSNFITPDPGAGDGRGGYALFVGRLSVEKGIDTLLAAWQRSPGGLPLKIVGDGPLVDRVREASARSPSIEWLGYQPRAQVHALLKDAVALILPSTWYEGALPRTVLEAFAAGTPSVASDLGSMSAEIAHGTNGRLFKTGDAADLAAQVEQLVADPARLAAMRRAARAEYEARYTRERNHEMLLTIYRRVARGRTLPLAESADERTIEREPVHS